MLSPGMALQSPHQAILQHLHTQPWWLHFELPSDLGQLSSLESPSATTVHEFEASLSYDRLKQDSPEYGQPMRYKPSPLPIYVPLYLSSSYGSTEERYSRFYERCMSIDGLANNGWKKVKYTFISEASRLYKTELLWPLASL